VVDEMKFFVLYRGSENLILAGREPFDLGFVVYRPGWRRREGP